MIYTPYVGNQIPIYNGTGMAPTTFAELSIAITDTSKNPAASGLTKSTIGSSGTIVGTVRLSHGPRLDQRHGQIGRHRAHQGQWKSC
jgi:hypothetical protein